MERDWLIEKVVASVYTICIVIFSLKVMHLLNWSTQMNIFVKPAAEVVEHFIIYSHWSTKNLFLVIEKYRFMMSVRFDAWQIST